MWVGKGGPWSDKVIHGGYVAFPEIFMYSWMDLEQVYKDQLSIWNALKKEHYVLCPDMPYALTSHQK